MQLYVWSWKLTDSLENRLPSWRITLLISLRSKNMRDVLHVDVWGMMIWCGQTLLPQSLRLWSPLPPLLVRLRSVPQAFWRWSQNVCTDRWWAAHQQAPLHPCQDSTVPFRRGRSLRPGWNTEGGFKGSQEWSLMRNRRTGRDRSWMCGGPLGTCSTWWEGYTSSPPTAVASLVFDNF